MSSAVIHSNSIESNFWRKEMRVIVDGIKNHMNLRSDTQAAEFLGISRQHLHISILKNKLMPDRLIETCIKHDIDITRLLKDGRATKLSNIDYSDTDVPLKIYREGSIIPKSKRDIPKWFAERVFRREIGLDETLGLLELETDEMEPKIKEGSIIYIDTLARHPIGGFFYVNLNGYGVLRRLVKATMVDKWHLTGHFDDTQLGKAVTHGTEFNIIGKCQFVTTKI